MIPFDPNLTATLIYDGIGDPGIPQRLLPQNPEIGCHVEEYKWARGRIHDAGQFAGSSLEMLCEIAGRACYDSFGKGRDSASYHQHIAHVGHGSVWEHANITVELDRDFAPFSTLVNRPGVWVTRGTPSGTVRPTSRVRITANLRAIIEWRNFEPVYPRDTLPHGPVDVMQYLAWTVAPRLIEAAGIVMTPAHEDVLAAASAKIVDPEHNEECWVTLLLTGSRGFSHEQVRHGDHTAISQRSTRYVDESGSPWVEHPAVTAFKREDPARAAAALGDSDRPDLGYWVRDVANAHYDRVVAALQPWLMEKGADRTTARKQARGAARGYLGNALYTEIVFSASVGQWLRMLQQRCSGPADAEIRVIYAPVLHALKASRYGDRFAHLSLAPSPDGIGEALA